MTKPGASSKASPNDSSAPRPIEPIPISQVSAFFGKAPEGRSETWRAALIGSPHHAWVKFDDDRRRIIADMVCSQVGRAIGLPIPKPHLVMLQPEDIPQESAWHGRHQSVLCFASQHAGKQPRSFARHMKGNNADFKLAVARWTGLYAAMIFDEWIANDDRHPGNLLFDPADNGFWMIDHGNALTGEYWPLWGLEDAAISMDNALADSLIAEGKPAIMDAVEIARAANSQMRDAANILWSAVGAEGLVSALDPSVKRADVTRFLMERIQHTTRLLMARMGHPQLDLSHGTDTRPVDACLH